MSHIRLIHWNAAESAQHVAQLEHLGYSVSAGSMDPSLLSRLSRRPPVAAIIDLTRQPAGGRDAAIALRMAKATRRLPLVFAGGPADKVAALRRILPDAVYTSWGRMSAALRRAIACPPQAAVVPRSRLVGYAGTPLPQKLGIKPDSRVALVGAPLDFSKTLGVLPPGAILRRRGLQRRDLTICFVKSRRELEKRIAGLTRHAANGGLWIAWPKQASAVRSDLTQAIVRQAGLDAGLVDFKICAIDSIWSGLRFSHPRGGRGRAQR